MKIALHNGELSILVKGPAFDAVRSWDASFRYDRKTKLLKAPATYDVLEEMDKHIVLTPKLRQELERLREKVNRINAERVNEEPVPIVKYPVRANLYRHQIRAANMALIKMEDVPGGFGLLMDMGAGKSLTAIAIGGALHEQGKVNRVLVIAPSSVCSVWPKDLGTFADFGYEVATLLGTKKYRLDTLKRLTEAQTMQWAVINYESTFREGVFEALKAYDADMIICDESQRIKTHTAEASKAMHKLGDKARYKLILSGTPVTNSAVDLYSQYRFMDSRVFGTNFYGFKARYCQMGGFGGKQIVGYKNTDELIHKEYSAAYRVTKDECLDLPAQIFEQRIVHFTTKERDVYNSIKAKSFAELEDGGTITASTILTKLLRLQQLTGGFIPQDDEGKIVQGSTAKLEALADIFQDYVKETGEKIVVFARFTAEIRAIEALAEKLKIKHCTIDGGVPLKERGAVVKTFQEDESMKVIICQLQCAGLGITLTAASTCVYYSLDFNYANYQQSLARIHRIGQTKKCLYLQLIVEDSIDSHTLAALDAKADLAKSIVDSWREYFKK